MITPEFWSGNSVLLYDESIGLDSTWWQGESYILDANKDGGSSLVFSTSYKVFNRAGYNTPLTPETTLESLTYLYAGESPTSYEVISFNTQYTLDTSCKVFSRAGYNTPLTPELPLESWTLLRAGDFPTSYLIFKQNSVQTEYAVDGAATPQLQLSTSLKVFSRAGFNTPLTPELPLESWTLLRAGEYPLSYQVFTTTTQDTSYNVASTELAVSTNYKVHNTLSLSTTYGTTSVGLLVDTSYKVLRSYSLNTRCIIYSNIVLTPSIVFKSRRGL